MPRTHEELVTASLAGDQDAVTELYVRLKPLVGRVAWRFFHGSMDGEDFECDCLSKLIMKMHLFDGNAKFTTWATRVAINTALMQVRLGKNRRENTISYDAPLDDEMTMPMSHNIADTRDGFARLHAREDAKKILDRMSQKRRRILIARHMYGYSNEQIAQVEGTTLQGAKSLVNKALTEAREVMDVHDVDFNNLATDSEEGMQGSPVADRVVAQRRFNEKTCKCPCGQTFTPRHCAQKYIEGHAPAALPAKNPRGPQNKPLLARPPVQGPESMVHLRVPASSIDKILLMLPMPQKLMAVEKIFAEL